MTPHLTLLTERVPSTSEKIKKLLRHEILGRSEQEPRSLFRGRPITGHYAVTANTLSGLKKTRGGSVSFNYNPPYINRIMPNVLVLSGPNTLRFALELKRRGRIKFLAAGPNISVMPQEDNGVLLDSLLDLIIVPSEWVKVAYIQQSPGLKEKIEVWPVGLDPVTVGRPGIERDTVLVYWKTEDYEFICDVRSVLKKNFPSADVVTVKYGEYKLPEYYASLRRSILAVFVSRSESQGVALLEAWMLDVPTIVWDPQEFRYNGWDYSPVSAAPYLTRSCGRTWKKIGELDALTRGYSVSEYAPREWALQHFSDSVRADELLTILERTIKMKK